MFHFLHCPLSGPVLIYISLLIIFGIIEYVTNLDLEMQNVIFRCASGSLISGTQDAMTMFILMLF